MVDVFIEFGPRARVATWRLDIKRVGERGSAQRMGHRRPGAPVVGREPLSPRAQPGEGVRGARSESRRRGSRPHAHRGLGVRRRHRPGRRPPLVLIGRGTMSFHPAPETESGQVKIFCGQRDARDALRRRLRPPQSRTTSSQRSRQRQLQPKAVGPERVAARGGSLSRGLAEVVHDRPRRPEPRAVVAAARPGDFLAEVRTRRFDTLTYARSASEAEDITLFDRKRHRNISIYPSKRKLAQPRPLLQRRRARRLRRPRLRHRRRRHAGTAVARRPRRGCASRCGPSRSAADAAARRIAGRPVDRQLRARPPVRRAREEPEHVVVNLPTTLQRDAELTLTITYAGRLEPQTPDRETLALTQGSAASEDMPIHRRRSRASCTATAATGIRRRRSATTRRRAFASRSRRRSTAWPAASWSQGSRHRGQHRTRRAAD